MPFTLMLYALFLIIEMLPRHASCDYAFSRCRDAYFFFFSFYAALIFFRHAMPDAFERHRFEAAAAFQMPLRRAAFSLRLIFCRFLS